MSDGPSATYTAWWDVIHESGAKALVMAEEHHAVAAPSERGALAEQAREAGRRLYFLADTLELQRP